MRKPLVLLCLLLGCGQVSEARSCLDRSLALYRERGILPLAYFIRNIPLVTSAVEGSLRQMDATLEDAARGLGASRWLALRRVGHDGMRIRANGHGLR